MLEVRVELTDAELLLRGGLQRRDAIDCAVVVVAAEQEHQRPALHSVVEGQLKVPDEPLHLLCQRLVAAVVMRGEPAAPAIARVVGRRALKQQPARMAWSASAGACKFADWRMVCANVKLTSSRCGEARCCLRA